MTVLLLVIILASYLFHRLALLPNASPHLTSIVGVDYRDNSVYYFNSTVYDFYSLNEKGLPSAGSQWQAFPLPSESHEAVKPWASAYGGSFPVFTSPSTKSNLAFVDHIFIMSDPSLKDRHANINRMFTQHEVFLDAVHWKLKWNRESCNDEKNYAEVYGKMNLQENAIGKILKQKNELSNR